MADFSILTDQELTALLNKGSEPAFAEIYSRYWTVLFLHARHILHEKEEARDIVQNVFTGLWQNVGQLDFNTSPSAFLYKSVRNKVFDHMKHKRVVNDYLQSLNEFINEAEVSTDALIREKELAEIIEREIQALPAKMREVFELSRKQHLSYQQIAEKLGVTEHTVKSQVSNALRILRAKVGLSAAVIVYLMQR